MAEEGAGRTGAALLVGIGDYLVAERLSPLHYAARDARALAETLLDPDVCGFPRDRVMVLTDQDARRDDVVHRLSKWLPEKARGADIAFVYFAGHGTVQRVGLREEGFLLPYDVDPEDLVTRGVAMSDVARWIEGIDAGAVVVCLDCCHAGKVVTHQGTVPEPATRDMRLRPTVLQGLSGKGRFLIASCDEGQTSVEAEGWGHGLFTYHLLQGLRGAGDRDGDGKVGVAELFEYVAAAVERDARSFGTEQRPWYNATGPGGVYLATPRKHTGESPRAEPEAAIRTIEDALTEGNVAAVLAHLGLLIGMGGSAGLPTLFRCLAHPSAEVRQRARKGIQALGWERVSTAVAELARCGDVGRFGDILDGLAAFESHRDVVALLDRLVAVLKGDLRNRAILLLERKRLSLDLERTAQVFRELQSPYEIRRALGQGLITAAFLARDEMNELDVVVRILRPELAGQPHLRARFLDLSRQSVRYVHHNLVLTRESRAFPDRQLYYTVRDHVDGVTLQKLLESGRVFDPAEILAILRQIFEALTPIHAQGALHGAIKPSNVFLGRQDRVIVGDVSLPLQGISMALDRLSYDYRYAPPEMFRGGGAIGPRSDFYALGCVAYELACGRPPFVADNPFELATMHDREEVVPPSRLGSRLGPAGDDFIQRLLAKSPADRFASLEEVLRAAASLREDDSPGTRFSPEWPQSADRIAGEAPRRSFKGKLSGVRPARSVPDAYEDLVSIVQFSTASRDEDLGAGSIIESRSHDDPDDPLRTADSRVKASDIDAGGLEPLPERFGRYIILGMLGRGGMGAVYKARDEALGRQVALKVLSQFLYDDPRKLARFRTEAQIAARLQHPNFVQIFDVAEQDRRIYLALELVEGGSLDQRLGGEPMPPSDAARLLITLARAVHHAHSQGIIHRDLKPSNILFTADGIPKIADFGLARHHEEDMGLTRSGEILGTPAYMSPEQALGNKELIGPASDIFTLGVILYELLTGQRPFRGDSMAGTLVKLVHSIPVPPSRLQAGIPGALERICMKCLEKEPDRRYTSAEDLAQDLERLLAGEPPRASRISLWQRLLSLVSGRR